MSSDPIQYPDTPQQMLRHLTDRLHDVVPEVELRHKAELAVQINRLKREKHALILGHNYMEPALFHSVPDFVGDSLERDVKGASRAGMKTALAKYGEVRLQKGPKPDYVLKDVSDLKRILH